jgi:hypothetical protein
MHVVHSRRSRHKDKAWFYSTAAKRHLVLLVRPRRASDQPTRRPPILLAVTTTMTTETPHLAARVDVAVRAWPRRVWRAVAGPLVTALTALAAAVQALRLWDWRPGLPLSLSGDAPPVLLQVREFMGGSWFGIDSVVGAPFGFNSAWFPTGNAVHLPLIRLLGLFSNSPATVATAFFVLQFPLAALAAYWLAGQLGISRPLSVSVGVLFAVLPGHQLWFGHLWLAAYWVVPLALWLVIRVGRGDELWPTRDALRSTGRRQRLALTNAARTIAVLLAVGLSDVYYVVFTLILLAAVLVLRLGTGTRPRHLMPGIGVAAFTGILCVGSLLVASRGRTADVVAGALPAHRVVGESETYAGKLIELVLPWYQHRAEPLRYLTWAYSVAAAPPSVERPALGIVALAGVVGLLWAAIAALATRRPAGSTASWLSIVLLVCLAFYTRAGLGSVVALFVTPQIRTWSRFVVFIELIGLLAVGLWLTSRPRLRDRRVAWPIAVAIIALGVLDQTNPAAAPDYRSLQAQQAELVAFGTSLHEAVGDCAVFQLPVVAFPEEPPPGRMDDYDHLLPSLLSPAGLKWSYGAIRGTTRADWQLALPVADTPKLLDDLTAAGFCAVEVDREGYSAGKDPTQEIGRLLGPATAETSDGHLTAYSLEPLQASFISLPAEQQATERNDVLTPSMVTLQGSLVDVDGDGTPRQWTGPTATLQVANMGDATRRLRVSLDITAADGHAGTVTVTGPVVGASTIALTSGAAPAVLEITALPGLTTVSLTSTSAVTRIPGGDGGFAALRIANLHATDSSSTANVSSGQQFAAESPPSGR